jgi:cellulose synthase/poly-beta-1,6-N-acetylglucosamine synthase-like glycosyltransferase
MGWFLLLCGVFVVGYALYILYYSYLYIKIPKQSLPTAYHANLKITVVIPARNEAANISNCLNSILACNYPSHLLQIIVVDDFSEDATAEIVNGYKEVTLLQLKNIVSSKINSYKKKAIEYAIAHATGEVIITTDADCIVPKPWLQCMAYEFETKNIKCAAGPVLIKPVSNIVGLFQQLDFMCLQAVTAVAVTNKQLTMCSGANFAYSKNAFIQVNGFKGIDDIASGDDMLLMHKIFVENPNGVAYINNAAAIVQTAAVPTWKAFMNQRIRWASKSDKYADKRILPVLLLVYGANLFLFFGLMISAVFFPNYFIYFVYLLLTKTFCELQFILPVSKFYNLPFAALYFIILEPIHILYTIIAGWLAKFGSYTWKDRKVK